MNLSEKNLILGFGLGLVLIVFIFGPSEYRNHKLKAICNDEDNFFSYLNSDEKCDNIIKKVVKDTSPYKFFWDYIFDEKSDEKIKELLNKYENENQEDIFDRDEKGF